MVGVVSDPDNAHHKDLHVTGRKWPSEGSTGLQGAGAPDSMPWSEEEWRTSGRVSRGRREVGGKGLEEGVTLG